MELSPRWFYTTLSPHWLLNHSWLKQKRSMSAYVYSSYSFKKTLCAIAQLCVFLQFVIFCTGRVIQFYSRQWLTHSFRESKEKQDKYAKKLAKMKKDAEEYVSYCKLFRYICDVIEAIYTLFCNYFVDWKSGGNLLHLFLGGINERNVRILRRMWTHKTRLELLVYLLACEYFLMALFCFVGLVIVSAWYGNFFSFNEK
jgi:hypothetical protein